MYVQKMLNRFTKNQIKSIKNWQVQVQCQFCVFCGCTMKLLLLALCYFCVGSGFLINEEVFRLLKSFPEIVIYDLETNKTMGAPYVEYPILKADEEGMTEEEEGQEETQEGSGWPCQCQDRTCGCCFGMNIDRFNFSQESECFSWSVPGGTCILR